MRNPTLLVAAALAVAAACAPAETPPVGEPTADPAAARGAAAESVAVVARRQFGQARVTTVLDGHGQAPLALFHGIDAAEAARLLQAGGEAAEGPQGVQWRNTYSGFLVDTGGRRVLIDTGGGPGMPGAGQLVANLAAAGATPESVQTVVITHFHGDHIGGLLDAEGRARFPNATVYAHPDEIAHWTNPANAAAAPAARRGAFEAPRKLAAAYGDRLRPHPAGEIAPGLVAEPATGHTPGHTVYRLISEGRTIWFIGDLMHARSIQMPHPEVTLAFDSDANAARGRRLAFLDRVADQDVLIAGPHFPFPGVGKVRKAGTGYSFTPAE